MKVCVPFGNGKVVHAIYADLFSLPRISICLFACNKHAQHSAAKMFDNRSKKKQTKTKNKPLFINQLKSKQLFGSSHLTIRVKDKT